RPGWSLRARGAGRRGDRPPVARRGVRVARVHGARPRRQPVELRHLSGLGPLSRPGWLDAPELRIGLGCMRMSTREGQDEQLASETIAAAAEAGVTVFDT